MRKDFEDNVNNIEKQINDFKLLINNIFDMIHKTNLQNREEHLVKHDLTSLWDDAYYMFDEVLYHMVNCIDCLKRIIKRISDEKTGCSISTPDNTISYELDSLLVSFWRINDDIFFGEIKRYLSNDLSERIDHLFMKNDNVKYWRYKTLRNRAAHGPKDQYISVNGKACRFCSFLSNARMCYIKDDGIEIPTTLIDICKINGVEKLIENLLKTNGGSISEIGLWGRLVEETGLKSSPKGVGKRTSQMLYPNQDILFDIYKDFFGLATDMIEYMTEISKVFEENMKHN